MDDANGPPETANDVIRAILEETRTIALVGASHKQERASWRVMQFMQKRGFRVIPINPGLAGQSLLGETVYASLADIPPSHDPIQMVDIFRNSEAAGDVVDDAINALKERGLETIWMQLDVVNEPAAARAMAAGLRVVMNRCPKIELGRITTA